MDDAQRVVGVVPLRRLLLAEPGTPVRTLQEPLLAAVRPETDGEEVARLVARYDLLAIPAVDADGRLLGTISVQDVLDVLDQEASEDIFRLAGSDVEELERRPPARIALIRRPWILATVAIELGAGAVIHAYDATLSRVILLASFMPVIQAISGNTGLQSVAMVVRGLATGHVRLERWWEPLRRQLETTAIIGAVCGALMGLVGALWHGTAAFGLVGMSMFLSVNLSGLAGTGIPMLSRRLGFDPAMTAGPFETALQDLIGVAGHPAPALAGVTAPAPGRARADGAGRGGRVSCGPTLARTTRDDPHGHVEVSRHHRGGAGGAARLRGPARPPSGALHRGRHP